MPQVKTVSVHYGRKVNLGDFNSANVECQVWADVEPDEDLHEAMTQLWGMVKANVKEQVLPLVAKQSAQVRHSFLGLPMAQAEPEPTNGDGNGQERAA